MGKENQAKENTDKKDEIIAVAQRWFGLYGFRKTSMNDIANELTISKGLLYYYFPDKEHLYNAVVEKEMEEFIKHLQENLKLLNNPSDRLMEYVKLRMRYFRTMLNLSRLRFDEFQKMKPVMNVTFRKITAFEKRTILDILMYGNEQKIFQVDNPEETSELFFDLLHGLRLTMIKDHQHFYLDQQEFDNLAKKAEAFVGLFICGLSRKQ